MKLVLLLAIQEGEHAASAGPTSPFEVNFGLFFWNGRTRSRPSWPTPSG
jgi:hypothetical protein